jgi:hypothetical protein
MKKTFLAAILIICCLTDYAQLIKGYVFDASTKNPVPSVSVFFNSTTVGTSTGSDGSFFLQIPNSEKLPVAISAIGYHSILLSDYSGDTPLQIFLEPKIYPIPEVIVESKRSFRERTTREKRLDMFRKQFLGETLNARRCEILNEKDLVFQSLAEGDILKAYSLKPLVINNEALAYQIIYYLDTFEFSQSRHSLSLYGNQIFREDTSLTNSGRKKAEKRRQSAYLGSRMHFFRSLSTNNLDSAGFILRSFSNLILSPDSLVIGIDSVDKYLKYKGVIYISYFTKSSTSSIVLQQGSVFFNKFGYFDPFGISWSGELSKQRIGDLLPYDYQPVNEKTRK